MSFRSQLWSLERATPNYGADTYATYGDDAYDDVEDLDEPAGARVHALHPGRRSAVGPANTQGAIGAAALGPAQALPAAEGSAPVAAIMRRRALAYRRRRQVLAALVLTAAAGIAPALLLGGWWRTAEAVAASLLVAYVGLLVRRGRHEAERVQKVRYLTPIRAPRPSVVVIGSGAVR